MTSVVWHAEMGRVICPRGRFAVHSRDCSLALTIVLRRWAIASASAGIVVLLNVKLAAIPALEISMTRTLAVQVAPLLVSDPVTYACTLRNRANCFAC